MFITPNSRQCGACANWGGERKPTVSGIQVEVKDLNVKGQCFLPERRYGAPMPCCSSCSKFEKWSGLK